MALTYTLIDDAGRKVELVGNEVRLRGNLDYETSTTLTFTVRATDENGWIKDFTYTVPVIDVVESDALPVGMIPAEDLGYGWGLEVQVSEWASGPSDGLVAYNPANVRKVVGGVQYAFSDADYIAGGVTYPFSGAETQWVETESVYGSWRWYGTVPQMFSGGIFAFFTYPPGANPKIWCEMDFEFIGADLDVEGGMWYVRPNLHMRPEGGVHVQHGSYPVYLGFDASAGPHLYEAEFTPTAAIYRVDGIEVARITAADMPNNTWSPAPMRSFTSFWARNDEFWSGEFDGTFTGERIGTLISVSRPPKAKGVSENQTWTKGEAIVPLDTSLDFFRSGTNEVYSATGLPPGLSINSDTGVISGTPTTSGTSNVVVTKTDVRGHFASSGFDATVPFEVAGTNRVLISTDIGGDDKDDAQSFIHALLYADRFNYRGFVSTNTDDFFSGGPALMDSIIDNYEVDLPNLRTHSPNYPDAATLRAAVVPTANIDPTWPGVLHEGAQKIIDEAKLASPEDPLWVLTWGPIHDLARALYEDPSIVPNIRVYAIAGLAQDDVNTAAWNWLDNAVRTNAAYQGLWMINSESAFRGFYCRSDGTPTPNDNVQWVIDNVDNHGALGERYFNDFTYDLYSDGGHGNGLKMGDTPSLLYLINGDPNDPAGESWGGSFEWNGFYWVDSTDPADFVGALEGADTVYRHRTASWGDFAAHLDQAQTPASYPTTNAVNSGGIALTVNDVSYAADRYYHGDSFTYQSPNTIVGASNQTLYQQERYGKNFGYSIPLANGTYEVTLRFAETVQQAAGIRIFDAYAEGILIIDNLDIWAAAGGQNIPYDVTVNVAVTDNSLDIDFITISDYAKICAIEAVPTDAVGVPIITSSATRTAVEGEPKVFNMTANEPVTWSIFGGADAADFSLTGRELTLLAQGLADLTLADDDFAAALNAAWVSTPVAGGTITSGVTVDTETALAIFIPDGDFDIYNTIRGSTLLQPAENGDWQMQAQFLTSPTVAFNGHGLLVKADDGNWIYFRLAKFDTEHLLQVVDTVGGVSSRPADLAVLPADAAYLRVTRSANRFRFERSADGVTWVEHYVFSRSFVPTEVGVAAHNTNHNVGDWTAHVNGVSFTRDNTRRVTLRATDSEANTADQAVTVTITEKVVVAENRVPQITTWTNGRAALGIPLDQIGTRYNNRVAAEAHHNITMLRNPMQSAATHTTVANGNWSSAATWSTGTVPGAGASVRILHTVTYDVESSAALKNLLIDDGAHLKWAIDRDTKLVVDTIYSTPSSTVTIGTSSAPVPYSGTPGKPRVDILFQGDQPGASMRLGLILTGTVSIHGEEKETNLVIADAAAGSGTVTVLGGSLAGWRVGDTFVVQANEDAGVTSSDPQYDGPDSYYYPTNGENPVQEWHKPGFPISHDEVRTITSVSGSTITLNAALDHSHITAQDATHPNLPRTGEAIFIPPIIALLSHTIRFSSVFPWGVGANNVQGRAHIMFMHSDNVDVRFAEAKDMGRTKQDATLVSDDSDKLETAVFNTTTNVWERGNLPIVDSMNVRGRYAWHDHETGPFFSRKMVVLKGVSAWGSDYPIPGWAIVQHSSRAAYEDCVVYNVRGAGMVSEVGNEIGQWLNNVVAWARGDNAPWGWGTRAETAEQHAGHQGCGFENQARQILLQGNRASCVNVGFMYNQMTDDHEDRIPHDWSLRLYDPIVGGRTNLSGSSDGVPENDDLYGTEQAQIPDFNDNVVISATDGIFVAHRQFLIRHDMTPLRSFGFKTIGCQRACNFSNYTWHYYFFNFAFFAGRDIGTSQATFMGPKTANVSWSNGVVTGYDLLNVTADSNFNGHFTDVVGVTQTQVSTRDFGGFDPTTHRFYPHSFDEFYPAEMGPWIINGTKVKYREYIIRSGLTPVTPTFTLDAVNDFDMILDAAEHWFGALEFQGRVVDTLGERHWPHWLYIHHPQGEPVFTVRRSSLLPHLIVERNGCWTPDGGVTWKMTLYFPDVDRVTGEYFIIEMEATLTGFSQTFLEANQIPGNAPTPPTLPLLPEAI